MKLITNISRLLVGSLFIISGLIKANDPIGFSYKLEEYFSADVLGMEWLGNYALSLALLVCIVEIVLGMATLLGTKMRLVSWALLLMIVFFTFLTFYSAYFNKVTDCGCFGDALKITPWQSFSKDIVLFVFVMILFVKRKSIITNTFIQDIALLSLSVILIAIFSFGMISWGFPVLFSLVTFTTIILIKNFTNKVEWISLGIPFLYSIIFSIYCIRHLPIRDFRPYAEDKSISEGLKSCEELELPCPDKGYIYSFKNKKSGEIMEKDSKSYMEEKFWENKEWEMLLGDEYTKPITYTEGYEPPIHDFSITSSDEVDYTEEVLNDPNHNFLLIAYDITDTNKEVQEEINDFANACSKKGISFLGLTSSTYEAVEEFRHDVQAIYDYHTTDETTLKTIIRSNPGLMLLKGGVIIKKWHYNDFPSFDEALQITNDN